MPGWPFGCAFGGPIGWLDPSEEWERKSGPKVRSGRSARGKPQGAPADGRIALGLRGVKQRHPLAKEQHP